jgi:hypothetical protein
MIFELSAEQITLYMDWMSELARLHAQEHENLDQVTVSFTFTPLGKYILAHTGNYISSEGCQIILQDL